MATVYEVEVNGVCSDMVVDAPLVVVVPPCSMKPLDHLRYHEEPDRQVAVT